MYVWMYTCAYKVKSEQAFLGQLSTSVEGFLDANSSVAVAMDFPCTQSTNVPNKVHSKPHPLRIRPIGKAS